MGVSKSVSGKLRDKTGAHPGVNVVSVSSYSKLVCCTVAGIVSIREIVRPVRPSNRVFGKALVGVHAI